MVITTPSAYQCSELWYLWTYDSSFDLKEDVVFVKPADPAHPWFKLVKDERLQQQYVNIETVFPVEREPLDDSINEAFV